MWLGHPKTKGEGEDVSTQPHSHCPNICFLLLSCVALHRSPKPGLVHGISSWLGKGGGAPQASPRSSSVPGIWDSAGSPPPLFSDRRAWGGSTTTPQAAPGNQLGRAGAARALVRVPSPASWILYGAVGAPRPDLRTRSARSRHQSVRMGRRGPSLTKPVPVSSSSPPSARGALNPPVSPLGVCFH
ncbi:hypothetical protein NDU88_001968 [Pleurodeles waltl]|uniref:Uncharacterized protein n=1 Tax=Pleurodeles waltl TaxID=8319 RepID=A0AAV7LIZ7_PLEWA|nr:hypothetical protein NDU88_001968 [Pleurodeles waltl]